MKKSTNHEINVFQCLGLLVFIFTFSNGYGQTACGASRSNPFTQSDRCMSETNGSMNHSFQDRIEAINSSLGMPVGSKAAGHKNKFRSLFVSGRINGIGGFAITDLYKDNGPNESGPRNRYSRGDFPGVIFAVDGDGDCNYEREDEFLEWAQEQEFDELILYDIAHLLLYGNREIISMPQPGDSLPIGGGSVNYNTMGEQEAIEWHLARFIHKAKTEYGFEVVGVVGKGTDSASFHQSFYTYHIDQTRSGLNYEPYLELFGDYCAEFFEDYIDAFLYNPADIQYKDYGEDTLFFPKDDDGRISTLDKLVVDVYNLYVFQMRTGFGMVAAGGGDPDAPASCNSLPDQSSCDMGFDAHMYEWEWWDTDDAALADFELDALVLLVKAVKNLLDTDVCPTGNYICQDRTERTTWTASNYTAQNRVDSIDNVADRVYMYAYNNNPCDLYHSSQATAGDGKFFSQNLELFSNNSFGANGGQTVIVPVFNAKYHSHSHFFADRPEFYGDNNWGCGETAQGDSCDFCFDYSGNALNSLVPNYPKQMGFVENVFQDQHDLDAALTASPEYTNQILGYCWFKSSLLIENDIISGVQDIPLSKENVVRVYPNPSITGNFRVETDVEITQIQVYSLTGQKLLDKNLNDFTNELSIKPKGVYILQVQTRDGELFRSKIINQ